MRSYRTAAALLAICLGLTGCSARAETEENTVKTVLTTEVRNRVYDVGLDYIGIVQPLETHNYAFLTGGKIEDIYVERGQSVTAGDPLAKLDTTQLELSASMSTSGMVIAQNNINTLTESLKASQEALALAELNLERTEALYEIGSASHAELEAAQLQVTSQQASHAQLENDLSSAQATATSSNLTWQQALQSLEDAVLVADQDGIVMEIPYDEGEIVGGGYPVIITKSEELMVTVGISVDDHALITGENPVFVNGTISGAIHEISAYPDPDTRTYTVKVVFSSTELSAGDTVDVRIFTGKEDGIFIPIESVFQVEGLDYVYLVNSENRVVKRQVTLGEPDGNMVRVTGLEEEERIIAEGVKLLSENDVVSVSTAETGGETEIDNGAEMGGDES